MLEPKHLTPTPRPLAPSFNLPGFRRHLSVTLDILDWKGQDHTFCTDFTALISTVVKLLMEGYGRVFEQAVATCPHSIPTGD